ncbi:HTH-type transcriptional regulator NimR [Pandoraea horticolens]|uniref:HTH-type transcriptional regulator NimR n=1 Tax=Pandoraea horticolens TaxID=2508298 RepID=A0A5E4WML2_9BURK|nr:hypothetical protein [Pandoraea horticolens]VVE24255.1 HTH-type transcriptional regulator NimR [Pandoraea horticolens]
MLTCEVAGALWIVPPHSAIWVPAGVVHKFMVNGTIECYALFIDPQFATQLPPQCCALTATPLRRELIVRSANNLPTRYPEEGMAAHLVRLLLDKIALTPIGKLFLLMPSDARLRKIVNLILENPVDRATQQSWSRRVAMSERTLAPATSFAIRRTVAGHRHRRAAGGRAGGLRKRPPLRHHVPQGHGYLAG